MSLRSGLSTRCDGVVTAAKLRIVTPLSPAKFTFCAVEQHFTSFLFSHPPIQLTDCAFQAIARDAFLRIAS
jgi:hypothetical protein